MAGNSNSGRRPKGTVVAIATGRKVKPEAAAFEDTAHGGPGAAPDWFDESQRIVWDQAVDNAPLGMFKAADRDLLMAYAQTRVTYERAVHKVREMPLVVRSERKHGKVVNHSYIANPYVRIQAQTTVLLLRFFAEMGFTPASRSRMVLKTKQLPQTPGEGDADFDF